MARLSGRTAIVTGGAVGIGRHYSQALAAEGAQVMIADIKDGAGLAAEIAAKHGRNSTDSMTFDVSDEAQCKALVAKTMERFGKIDILINNAALYAPLPTLKVTEIDVDLWDKVMAVNIRGPFLMIKHVAPHMIAQEIRQDRQHRLGHGRARHPGLLALRHLQGRGDGVHPLHVARARRRTASASTRWRRAIRCPTPASPTRCMSSSPRPRRSSGGRSSATNTPRTCSER